MANGNRTNNLSLSLYEHFNGISNHNSADVLVNKLLSHFLGKNKLWEYLFVTTVEI